MLSVDVIVPCYQYGCFLQECVESVLSQEGVAVRVLILDDASPDHTGEIGRELAHRDKRVLLRTHAQNKGHIATYNEGIEWASADFLLLLSADDYLLPGALHRSASLMKENPEVGFTFGKAIVLSENAFTQGNYPFGRAGSTPQEGVLTGRAFIERAGATNIVPTPTALVRTALQKRLGGYRPELPHSGDMEMWLRLAAHASVGFIGEPQAVYRQHSGNMSRLYIDDGMMIDLQERKAALEQFFEDHGESLAEFEDLRRMVFRRLALNAIKNASGALNDGHDKTAEELSRFALSIDPSAMRSWPGIKFAGKCVLGAAQWRALNAIRLSLAEKRTR